MRRKLDRDRTFSKSLPDVAPGAWPGMGRAFLDGMSVRLRVLSPLVLALVTAKPAAGRPVAHFLLDGVAGVNVPLADSSYTFAFDPSPTFGLHLGAEVWLSSRIGLAPEFALDGGPFIGRHSAGITTGRLRFQPGLRLLVGIGHGHAVLIRWLIGGEVFVFGPGGRQGSGTLNVGFATEPGAGMQFRVARHTVLGFVVGFPIGVHSFGAPPSATNADFDVSFFVGYR
jgi:hypothetical protein